MHVVIRSYSGNGASALIDLLEKHVADVEAVMRSVQGFVSYTLARSEDGGVAVTVCEDRVGVDESIQKAREWIAGNAADIGAPAPAVSFGDVILQLR